MQALSATVGTGFYWVQPNGLNDRWFELRTGDAVVATLGFESLCSSLARAESADGSWTLKQVGILNRRVTVRRAGEEAELAVYTPRWTGREGVLEFPGGRVFYWTQTNFWATEYQITDPAGNLLVSVESGAEKPRLSDVFKTQARVEIGLRGRALPELSLLVLLGWYLIILQKQDTAVVAATTVAVMG